MKKILLVAVSLFFACAVCRAQGKTSVRVLGQDKGAVASMQTGGVTLVDAQATAKKLGGGVELFSASKSIKIAFPGMYALVGAGQQEAVINGQSVALPARIVASGGKLYVPVQLFLLPAVQKALNRQITFEQGAIVVERHFTVAFSRSVQQNTYDQLHFWLAEGQNFSVSQPNKHTVRAVFPGAVLKRTVQLRPKSTFIRSWTLAPSGKDAVLTVIFGKNGKVWNLEKTGKEAVFSIAAKVLPAATAEQKVLPPANVLAEDEADELPAPTEAPEILSSPVAGSDVAEDDIEELDLTPSAPGAVELKPGTPSPAPQLKAPSNSIISAADPENKTKRKMRIIVDPGHGGKDPGAVRAGSAREKELNLAVAKYLTEYLKGRGFEVRLTRTNDSFVELASRSKMANEYQADLFVSVHTNAAKRPQANGFEVYFRSDKATDKEAAEVAAFENEALQYEETHYNFVDRLLQSLAKNEYMNESSKLAGHIRNYVYQEPGIGIAVARNSAIRQANFYVLRGVHSPAVLIEMGYISSPKDRKRLNLKAVQKRMGEGIGKGIVSYAKAEGWKVK